MSDLVKKLRLVAQKRHVHNLRTLTIANADTALKAADRIEQLERELEVEKELADRLARAISDDLDSWPTHMMEGSVIAAEVAAYRKARGME